MRSGCRDGTEERYGWWIVAVVALIAVVAIGWAVVGCYPMPPVNPPSCAQDPTQEWCVPPPFQAKSGCALFRVDIDQDAGVRDPLGVWHYPARASSVPCPVDAGAK